MSISCEPQNHAGCSAVKKVIVFSFFCSIQESAADGHTPLLLLEEKRCSLLSSSFSSSMLSIGTARLLASYKTRPNYFTTHKIVKSYMKNHSHAGNQWLREVTVN